ncbi:MAG: S1 RNA-binding domain-containing protein, partial [Myxococcales bacterium]
RSEEAGSAGRQAEADGGGRSMRSEEAGSAGRQAEADGGGRSMRSEEAGSAGRQAEADGGGRSMRSELGAVAARCSERERAAMGVEREVDAYYAALLMRDHVGESFDGTIDAAVEAGLFVELDRYLVSGLVPALELGEGAVLEREKQRWVLPRSGRAFRIGGRLRVTVVSVNVARRQIDFALAEPVSSERVRVEKKRRRED